MRRSTFTASLLSAIALLAAACGGTATDVAADPQPATDAADDAARCLPDDATCDDTPGEELPTEDPGGGAAGMCLEGTVDCVDTPGIGTPDGGDAPADDLVGPDIPITEPFEEYRLIEPRDVVDDPLQLFLQWASVDGTTVRVGFTVGVEPCFVTSAVEVDETDEVVAITVYGGTQRGHEGEACVMMAESVAVDVQLQEPLGDRRLLDGSRATPADLGAR